MRRPRVLITAPRALLEFERYVRELSAAGCDVARADVLERLDEEQLLPLIGDVEAIVCGDDQITSRVLDAAVRLRIICKWGTGIDSIAVEDARRRGIKVRNTPGAFSSPVADTVMGYVLMFARQLDRMCADMRHGVWRRLPAVALSECTLGIVGFGSIGQAVARRAHAFGMRILACTLDPVAADHAAASGARLATLEEVLRESDFVTLHADLRPGNRHLLGAEQLRWMKPTCVLINTARGGLVDEPALIRALEENLIAGAALDVFEREPLPATSALRSMQNVHLAPHNANASPAAARRVDERCIGYVLEVLSDSSAAPGSAQTHEPHG